MGAMPTSAEMQNRRVGIGQDDRRMRGNDKLPAPQHQIVQSRQKSELPLRAESRFRLVDQYRPLPLSRSTISDRNASPCDC